MTVWHSALNQLCNAPWELLALYYGIGSQAVVLEAGNNIFLLHDNANIYCINNSIYIFFTSCGRYYEKRSCCQHSLKQGSVVTTTICQRVVKCVVMWQSLRKSENNWKLGHVLQQFSLWMCNNTAFKGTSTCAGSYFSFTNKLKSCCIHTYI